MIRLNYSQLLTLSVSNKVFFFSPLQTLHDPEAALVMQQGRGRIVCHVVDLLQTANND